MQKSIWRRERVLFSEDDKILGGPSRCVVYAGIKGRGFPLVTRCLLGG